ncbi:MAG: protein-disulfide reductase DsbD family protein [Alphaproteobacteria bacterium]|nr:protein-disulfide reductase DsbD family protein [Alphaproteobacteria bacterium]
MAQKRSIGFAALWLLAALIGMAAAPEPVQAKAGAWADSEHSSVRLISAVDAVGEADALRLGLEFQMQEGWKIYWRSPGDAGFPPRPDWARSENVASVEMDWPAPKRFSIFGLETFGYEQEVVFPLTVALERPGEPAVLAAEVEYLVCSDICIPGSAEVALELTDGAATPSRRAHAIDRFQARVPTGSDVAGLSVLGAAVAPAEEPDKLQFQIALASTAPLGDLDAFVEGPETFYLGKPSIAYSEDMSQALLTYQGGGVEVAALQGTAVTVTATDGARALEARATVESGPLTLDGGATPTQNRPGSDRASETAGLFAILGLALLGGLILNLMPCVLPVLSIKLLSVAKHGGGDRRVVRASFLASAAGVVASFLVIALALIAAKSAGAAIGWGVQFQNPIFLSFMTVVVVLFAGNLLGFYEIILPQRLTDRLARSGGGQASETSLSGHFMTGAFATLLATPCSAPFLGTAVGFALSRGPGEILAVFIALGIGLAAPYLLIAAAPRMATILPKPGPWMVKLKFVLALALLATGLWLATVIAAIAGTDAAIAVLALACLAVGVILTRRLEGSRLGRVAPVLSAALALAAIAAPSVNGVAPTVDRQAPEIAEGVTWIAFDPAVLRDHVAAGRVVFVDVTADWCITCQVNKERVLESDEIARLLATPEVVAMRADWTRPDPVIADYLASFGRYGIPFNAVYGPGSPRGVPLSELLVHADVTAALAAAAASGSALAARLAER